MSGKDTPLRTYKIGACPKFAGRGESALTIGFLAFKVIGNDDVLK